ncbi:hypothetical protein AMAG_07362 [Allomyces macrogynus ATCC 38327]|uniref:Uncharacterized protein n=1 Tax=Allomyces macrogynus (strain ATCC 38327) TaxID=578462 RepID=A0A0L0SIF5_ALLM3|nr:hypothetical protein AMAG_07362 [Allomyces macrogynus ATCC 38327]|eukprot:KNE62115.1 hypothetical protein AMAG_07362 [Allomyces macrogynus ATCC 38327]
MPTQRLKLSGGIRSSSMGRVKGNPLGWLYCARGFYKLRQYHQVIECLTPALRNDRTKKEAQHLLAFSFMHTGQVEAALGAASSSYCWTIR